MLCVYHTTPTKIVLIGVFWSGWDTTTDRSLGPKNATITNPVLYQQS